MARTSFVVSCEHASRHIPRAYRQWGVACNTQDHTAFDIGALAYAQALAQVLNAPLFCASVSRLLIDCNRSLHHPQLFGPALRHAPLQVKQQLIDHYYVPYRQQVGAAIAQARSQKHQVIHLAAHSFTPQLNGVTRGADIGLLYDPRRQSEKQFALRWQAALQAHGPSLRIRRNYPYRGNSDGFTTALRQTHSAGDYIGIEIEINQALLRASPRATHDFATWFAQTSRAVCIAASAASLGNK